MSEVLISFTEFSFTYKAQSEPTLKSINLSIRRGEKILIAGPSGSGKSTLGYCINALIPHAFDGTITGEAQVCGLNVADGDIYEVNKKVGTVMQDTDAQFVGITVAEDIAFALENQCVEKEAMHQAVGRIANVVHMGEFLSHSPQELSGGQKQRVSLAGV
ncbi:MAG: ABC transporter ATP-binding protein, partial [Sphaerochaeta sp.]